MRPVARGRAPAFFVESVMSTDAQRRANAKQDATRKRSALWLEPADAKALDKVRRKLKLPSRIAAHRALVAAFTKHPDWLENHT